MKTSEVSAENLLWFRLRNRQLLDHEVLKETDAVMERIRQCAETLTPSLSRKRAREQDRESQT